MVKTVTVLSRYRKPTGDTRFENNHNCSTCDISFIRYDTLPKEQVKDRAFYCSELCKAKAHILVLDNGCWELKSMRFVWNGMSCSVRAVLFRKAFNLSYEHLGLSKPRCGRKNCGNPAHLHFKEITTLITLEGL